MADPHFVNKAAENRTAEINTCIGCNQACLDFTFKGMRSSCLVNPTAGYESEMKEVPVEPHRAQRIAVVGKSIQKYSKAKRERVQSRIWKALVD